MIDFSVCFIESTSFIEQIFMKFYTYTCHIYLCWRYNISSIFEINREYKYIKNNFFNNTIGIKNKFFNNTFLFQNA